MVAVADLLNVNFLKSKSLAIAIQTGFITFVSWVLVGAFLVFHAQNKMKLWYEYEMYAHNQEELESLKKQYKKIYDKWLAVKKINKNKLKLI